MIHSQKNTLQKHTATHRYFRLDYVTLAHPQEMGGASGTRCTCAAYILREWKDSQTRMYAQYNVVCCEFKYVLNHKDILKKSRPRFKTYP